MSFKSYMNSYTYNISFLLFEALLFLIWRRAAPQLFIRMTLAALHEGRAREMSEPGVSDRSTLVWMILIDFHGLRRYVSHRFFFTTPRDAAFSRGTPRSTLVFFSLHVLLLLWCSSELPPDWPASPVYLPSLYLAKKLGKRILFPMHLSILFLSHLSPSFFLLEDVFQNMSLSHLSQSNLSR